MRAMIEGYYEAGWEVYLLAMNTKRHPVPAMELKTAYSHIQYVDSVPVDNEIKILPTIGNYLFSSSPNHTVRFFHLEFADKLVEVLKSFRPDVVQLESLYLATYMPYIKKNSGALTILRLHNIEHQVWDRLAAETGNPFKRAYIKNLSSRIRRFEHDVWGQFDLLLPITEDDADAVKQEHVNVNMTIVPFAIDAELIPATNIQPLWNAYHIGAMDWLPNSEAIKWFLDDVWPGVHTAHPEFKFYFAGRNMPDLFKHNLQGSVICAGEVPDAFQFIADKKILVVPLRSGGGIRVKILEAMAAGKIVISTDIGMQGINAIAGKHYLLANTAAAFIDKINWCLNNRSQADMIAKEAAQFVHAEYSNAHIMEGFIGRVEAMLKK